MTGEQLGFELWPRTHDLPPRWDGMPVDWGTWSPSKGIRLCGRTARSVHRCTHCGSTSLPVTSTGRVWEWDEPDPDPAVSSFDASGPQANTRRLALILTAFRCPSCRHDWVLDIDGQAWDLDDTDYTDVGSWPSPPTSEQSCRKTIDWQGKREEP